METTETEASIRLHRRLLLLFAGLYLVWWFAVELLLKGAFNPPASRVVVVLTIFAFYLLSFCGEWLRRRLPLFFVISVWLITAHYFYLFYGNKGDANWIVGSYITVTASSYAFFSNRSIFLYSLFVLVLSIGLLIGLPELRNSIFLPGLLTILIQANVGLRARHRAHEERVRAEALRESLRVRDEFISIASHELKTPLSAIRLQTQLIVRDAKSERLKEYTREKLDSISMLLIRQVDRLVELVETMLDVSRISSGQLQIKKTSIDIAEVIRRLVKSLLVQIHDSDQIVDVDAPEKLIIMADPDRLVQVIENLLTNAIKYGSKKKIRVVVATNSSSTTIAVIDQGIGIAPEFLPRIFDRFERGISSTNISGLGLGLFIARQFVEAHGGSIRVQSALGQGSTFTLELPSR